MALESLGQILHRIVDVLHFRQESDITEIRDAIDTVATDLADKIEGVGRNVIPAGVVEFKAPEVTTNDNLSTFPVTPTE